MSAKRQPSISVEEILGEMGLRVEVLHETVTAGERARNASHKFDPKGAAGFDAYKLRIRTLRLLLVPLGWTERDVLGCAMTVSPEGDRRIVIARGNEATGLKPLPSTFYKKGAVWRRAVESNQLPLPGIDTLPSESGPSELVETWVLLVWHEERSDMASLKKYVTVRSELSLPDEWHEDRPTGWPVRLPLPELVLEFPIEPNDDGAPPDSSPDGGDDGHSGGDDDNLDVPLKRNR